MTQRKRNEIFIYEIDGSENTRRLYIGLREIQKTVLKRTGEEGRGNTHGLRSNNSQKSEERIRSTDYRTLQTAQVKKQFLWDVLAENNRSLGT